METIYGIYITKGNLLPFLSFFCSLFYSQFFSLFLFLPRGINYGRCLTGYIHSMRARSLAF